MGFTYPSNLLSLFFLKVRPATKKAYQQDLENFRLYAKTDSIDAAVEILINLPHSQANLMVMHYKVELNRQELKLSTINRRISTLRSLVKEAKRQMIIPWTLEINNDKLLSPANQNYLTSNQIHTLLESSQAQKNPHKAKRDYAMIRLIYDQALKREVVAHLQLEDLNLSRKTLIIATHEESCNTVKKLTKATCKALKNWIVIRGSFPGPLFANLDLAKKGKGITSTSIYRIIRDIGKQCNLEVTPDLIRQSAIKKLMTHAERLGIDKNDIRSYSDFKSAASLKRYKKDRLSMQEELSKLVSELD